MSERRNRTVNQTAKPAMSQAEKMAKRARLKTRILPQIIIQSTIVIVTALCSFIFMTWVVKDIFLVENTYVAAAYEMLGTLVMLIVVLVPWNAVVYRRRIREVVTLSEAIQKVVGGDYTTKISTKEKSQITPIYEDFNKMCAELESVQILRNDFINNYSLRKNRSQWCRSRIPERGSARRIRRSCLIPIFREIPPVPVRGWDLDWPLQNGLWNCAAEPSQ